ncbi:MAG: Sigma-70, region 4 [Pyrinomonadaceae bacterium]|jgi:RNA polymerase sigma factor (sigma-70 family)|nr:Sigma-70, region 4 [Pyrinomonadaceae bacterium]
MSEATTKGFYKGLHTGNLQTYELIWQEGSRVIPALKRMKFEDAEDTWHDCWLNLLYTRCADYDPRKGTLPKWVMNKAILLARTRRRKKLRSKTVSIEETGELSNEDSLIGENKGGNQEKLALLEQGKAALSERDRIVISLKFDEGLESPAMAERLGTTSVAVRKRLSRAVRRLSVEIGRLNKDELRRPTKEPAGADSS